MSATKTQPREAGATLRVSPDAARRFLIRRTGLGRLAGERRRWPEPDDARSAVRALEYVQVDPMRVLETNHNLVLAARVRGYRPRVLDRLLYGERTLVEVVARNRYIVPIEDYHLFRVRFGEIEQANRPRLGELEPILDRVLARIRSDGPLSSFDFEEQETVSGWWDADGDRRTRAVRQALEWLWHFGRLAISHRVSGRRYFDLPERLLGPAAGEPLEHAELGSPAAEAAREGLARKYFRALGLADPRDWGFAWARLRAPEKRALAERLVDQGELARVAVEGVKTIYYLPAAEAGDLGAAEDWELAPDLHFLPPLDNLTWLRSRLLELFGFDYTWEAYIPEPKRRYGPYTCPILCGDRLIGRIDARMARSKTAAAQSEAAAPGAESDPSPGSGTLVINGLWWEAGASFPPGVDRAAFRSALEAWAEFNGASAIDDPTRTLD